MCCIAGDLGAPLEEGEIAVMERVWEGVRPYMTQDGIAVVEKEGVYVTDADGERVTPLVGDADCAFACMEDGIASCAFEKAYREGKTDFRKPLSCHLYPVRITKYPEFEAVNYHCWDICDDARKHGQKAGVPLYVFLKEALIRKYGEEWHEQLCIAQEMLAHKQSPKFNL
jgi:hypothetical protein